MELQSTRHLCRLHQHPQALVHTLVTRGSFVAAHIPIPPLPNDLYVSLQDLPYTYLIVSRQHSANHGLSTLAQPQFLPHPDSEGTR
jgi:hypothetical protein